MFVKSKTLFSVVAIICITGLSGCSAFKKEDDNKSKNVASSVNEAPQKMYSRAYNLMESKRYTDAIEKYNDFITQFPFGTLSEKARIERIFVLNKLGSTEEASKAVEQFIQQYPQHPQLDYAYFMRGIILFERKKGFILGRGASEVSRNKNSMEKSYSAFEELISRFPRSRYVPDAKQRLTHLRNKIAEHEFSVAQFYAERNAHVAVISRCQYILDNYQQSPAIIDALKLMVITYKKMGLDDLSIKSQRVLDANYATVKGGTSSNKDKESKPSLWSKLPKLPKLNLFKPKENTKAETKKSEVSKPVKPKETRDIKLTPAQ